ncbi:hypothetical protein B0H16DRAFT_1688459 [Mycena metata]|uniref:Transmembrane protein n=1 Tax=Mycena metata TaxID=1033252 RepID=A0AAD7JC86_9AGAR|nr:hypothetical protein B0H16DRAFT_1688459 [Mycena metata]
MALTLETWPTSQYFHSPSASTGSSFTDSPPNSAFPLLPNRRKVDVNRIHTDKNQPTASRDGLPTLCVVLHLVLVILHIMLLVVCIPHLEHFVVFPLDWQSLISPAISGIMTTFASIYCSALVLISQTLATRHGLHKSQTLTATHDNSVAWSGIGSALSSLWKQTVVPASVLGTLSVFLYLLNIAVIHISSPAMLSLQSFNSSRLTVLKTFAMPEYTRRTSILNETQTTKNMETFVMLTLSEIFQDMNTTDKLGILDGTLYEVLETSYVGEDASVAAIAFNTTCGYLPQPNASWNENGTWDFVFPSPIPSVSLSGRAPRMIGMAEMGQAVQNATVTNSVTMYTTIPILDSSLQTIPSVELDPPMVTTWNTNESVSTVQFFQCSQSLVPQTATVGAQSRQALTVEVGIEKRDSVWLPYSGPAPGNVNGSMIDMWARWLGSAPPLEIIHYSSNKSASPDLVFITFSEFFLMYRLNLIPEDTQTAQAPQKQELPTNLALHDVENALSSMMALSFWTLGHSPLVSALEVINHTLKDTPLDAPYLLEGTATVYEYVTETRLHLSIAAVVIGLLASTSLTALSVSYCKDQTGSNVSLAGSGLLHAIWLFRNHPDLDVVLPRVNDPTDYNLRAAGMIPVKLGDSVGGEPDLGYNERGH